MSRIAASNRASVTSRSAASGRAAALLRVRPAVIDLPSLVLAWTGDGPFWQDTAQTTRALVTSDPVRVIANRVPLPNAPTALSDSQRPIISPVGAAVRPLLFDGVDDNLQIPYSTMYHPYGGPFSIIAWYYRNGSGSLGPTVVSRWETTGNQRTFRLQLTATGVMRWNVSATGSSTLTFVDTAALSNATWHMIYAYISGSVIGVSLNNAAAVTTSFSTTLPVFATPLVIGATLASGVPANLMNTCLGPMYIMRALPSAPQLAAIYAAGPN